jgi:hypothetical protein
LKVSLISVRFSQNVWNFQIFHKYRDTLNDVMCTCNATSALNSCKLPMEGNSSIYWSSRQSRVSDDDATEISWARLVRLRCVSSIYLPLKSRCPVNSHPTATHNLLPCVSCLGFYTGHES